MISIHIRDRPHQVSRSPSNQVPDLPDPWYRSTFVIGQINCLNPHSIYFTDRPDKWHRSTFVISLLNCRDRHCWEDLSVILIYVRNRSIQTSQSKFDQHSWSAWAKKWYRSTFVIGLINCRDPNCWEDWSVILVYIWNRSKQPSQSKFDLPSWSAWAMIRYTYVIGLIKYLDHLRPKFLIVPIRYIDPHLQSA